MPPEIKKSLDSLLETVFDSEEHKKYKKAKENWDKSKESQKLLSQFVKERNTLGIYQQGGFAETAKQEKKVEDLHKKVKEDKNIEEWINQQHNYQEFIWKQTDYLTRKLGFPYSKKPSCGSGGCC